MAQVLSSLGLEPGVFAQFTPSQTFAQNLGGLRVLALVGTGITNANVIGEVVTKGSLNGQDTLAHSAVSLPSTITDENFVVYNAGSDYQLTSGNVDWSLANAAVQTGTVAGTSFAVSGLTLQVFVNGVTQTTTFSGSNPIAIATVISQISSSMTGFVVASNDGSNHVKLSTVGTNNTTLVIGAGTANTLLGFTEGLQTTSSTEPTPGVKYTLSYTRAKTSADYIPKTFFDLSSVVNEYGTVSTANSISLAAALAFQNGASVIMGMQVDPSVVATLTRFQQAIDKLRTVDLNIMVVLNPDPNLQSYIKAHVDQMSSIVEQRFRTALVGLGGSPTMSQVQTYAAGLKDRRIALVYPPQADVQLAGSTTPTSLDGTFIAAAIGGIRVNPAFDVAEPLLRKPLVGFLDVQDTLLRTQKNVLANSGVMIVETQNGTIRVRDGLTTDLTTADSAEYSVTEIIDFTAETSRTFLDAAFVGVKFLNDTPALAQASLSIILQSLIDNKILTDATNLSVKRNSINPSQIDVSFSILPVFPVKYILVAFTI